MIIKFLITNSDKILTQLIIFLFDSKLIHFIILKVTRIIRTTSIIFNEKNVQSHPIKYKFNR